MPEYACAVCRRAVSQREASTGESCPHCGRDAIVRVGEPPPARARAALRSLADRDRPLVRVPCKAPLVAGIDGLELPALVLVTGPAGAGKSTEVARMLVALRGELQGGIVLADREMSQPRCQETYRRAGADAAYLRRAQRAEDGDWRELHEETAGARVRVWDSLDTWAGRESEKVAMMTALRDRVRDGRWPVLDVVIAHFAREGHVLGSVGTDHAADVVIEVHPRQFKVTKCRWHATPARWRRTKR